MSKRRLARLCVASPWNYPLFNPQCQTHFGGWEVRIALTARELAKRGNLQVNLVVGDHGQPHVERRDGVTLYSWVGREIWGIPSSRHPPVAAPRGPSVWEWGWRKLRMRVPALKWKFGTPMPLAGQIGSYVITPRMLAVYDEVNADVYLVPGNSQFSGEVAFYCRQRGKKYVFLAGSDFDYYPEYGLHPDQSDMYGVPHLLKTYAIKSADAHILQNERQAELLKDGYGRSGVVIKNPIDLSPLFPRNQAAKTILWVGKSDERIKRPALVLELARQLSEYEFVVIMNIAVQETHADCVKKASELPNVTLVERVPFAQIESYFANARLHLNTSVFEGFPNTFLQAAKYGVPTVSLQVDPGRMLTQYACGVVCEGDFEKLKGSVRALMTDDGQCERISRMSRRYVRAHHDKDVIIQEYEQLLQSVLIGRRCEEINHGVAVARAGE